MKNSPEEQLKFLMEEFPQYFSLKNNKGDIICDNITFSNVLIKIERYDEKEFRTLFLDINVPHKCNIDLDYLKKNDYVLYFNDNQQKRIFKIFTRSYIIDKKNKSLRMIGTAYIFDYKFEYRLNCYILCGFGSFEDLNNTKVYKDAIKKRNRKYISVTSRFDILDL